MIVTAMLIRAFNAKQGLYLKNSIFKKFHMGLQLFTQSKVYPHHTKLSVRNKYLWSILDLSLQFHIDLQLFMWSEVRLHYPMHSVRNEVYFCKIPHGFAIIQRNYKAESTQIKFWPCHAINLYVSKRAVSKRTVFNRSVSNLAMSNKNVSNKTYPIERYPIITFSNGGHP